MSLTRRYFLKVAAAASAGALSPKTERFAAEAATPSKSPGERIGLAVFGAGGRGGFHVRITEVRPDVEILYLCDPDLAQASPLIEVAEKRQGRAPQVVQDFRAVLDDPNVDAVFIATPNHWHSLLAILAMQAGKHVYVEKPVSHNVWEGRQVVNWARRLSKICQSGPQSRSNPGFREAVKWVQDGNLGKIQYAIGTCYKARKPIGKRNTPLTLPSTLDYDLWCGPAAKVDIFRPQFHYDWHWDFNTGNGDMGNQGIHQMDIARWFLGESKLSPRIMSIGGRLGEEDAGDTPNTQITYHGYASAPLIFETRGLPRKGLDYSTGMDSFRKTGQKGVVVQCEEGFVLCMNYTFAAAYDQDGKQIKVWKWAEPSEKLIDAQFANFYSAIRSGRASDLNADILEGHLSSALCHTGAISHILGTPKTSSQIAAEVADNPLWSDSYQRLAEHLQMNNIEITSPTLTVGPVLEMDPDTETFSGNEAANRLLTREYRKGYEVPEANGIA